jgi:energy-coupling factor transporter ATP-binding protein EcfA2
MKRAEKLSDFATVFEPDALDGEDLNKFYYDGTMPIRMDDENKSPIKTIYKSCLTVKRQNAHLLLGHRGCGKSTELNMLKRRLEMDGRKVSVVECLVEADLQGISYWDLLILLGKHLCQIAENSNCDLPKSLLENIQNFWKDIEITNVTHDKYNTNVKAEASVSTPKFLPILNLFTGLSSELKFGSEKKVEIREKVNRSSAQWIGYMEEVSHYISNHSAGKQPIVIFEDLDKLAPNRAWEVFNNPLSQMPFPIIYTFPISLSYDPKFAQLEASFNNNVQILPMIKIRTPDRKKFNPGVDTIRNIVERRAELKLFDDTALTLLIEKTGGILRDLFHCITKAANRADNRKSAKIEMEDAEAAAIYLRSSLTRRFEVKDCSMLKNIYNNDKYKRIIENKIMLSYMMYSLIVLEYSGDRWHDLHPLVEDFLKEQGELS